ncbi:hypothetical protein RF644_17765 [Kocuria sp. CPCC 205258]|uniref:hypothetical protein n=1 Tax=Kocuria sp. CPCC 205258 TaxID=3073552 RepID=UPI0034D4AA5A
METTTNAPAQTAVPDAVTAALAAGHAPDSLAVHAAQRGLSTLEKPMTATEAAAAADEDGFLTAVVEVSLHALLEGRANEEAGEDYPVVRQMVEGGLEPVQMGYEVIGTSPANTLTLVASFDLREALGFRYDPGELDEMFGTAL